MADKDPTYRLTADGRVYRKGRRTYANLDEYDGEFLDGMKHGTGRLKTFNGDLYIGEFENNSYHGRGEMQYYGFYDENGRYIEGKFFKGDWKDNYYHGKGILRTGYGEEVYSGHFAKGLFHGMGTFKKENGDRYQGSWERGKPHGHMKIEWVETENTFSGMMRSGLYHGKGKMTFGGGLGYYDGEWERNRPHGQGARVYSNGTRYVGTFSDGEVHGEGIMFYVNGDQYIGAFHRGHLSGRGVMKYLRGDTYDGKFLNGFPYGEGKYTYADGSYYEGEYKSKKVLKATLDEVPICNGKRNGFGLRVFTNGARYLGSWVDDIMHGHGVLTQADGGKYEGQFFNGYRQGPGREQYGNVLGISYLCPMGYRHQGKGYCVYLGNFKRDQWHGQGTYECQDGRKYEGEFKASKKHGKGRQEYLRIGDAGDPDRQCIGGRGSMYRFKFYEGEWQENVREGHGVATFVNDDTLTGEFRHGQPHGIIEVLFHHSNRMRFALYERGTRKERIKNAKAMQKARKALENIQKDIFAVGSSPTKEEEEGTRNAK